MNRALNNFIVVISFASVVAAQSICSRFRLEPGRCDLTAAPVDQSKCLLRPVEKFANLGAPLRELPAPLESLIGQSTTTTVTPDQVRRFLRSKGIDEADLGGSLSVKLTKLKYFVIHDTSDLLEASDFPANIDDPDSSLNKLSRRVAGKKAHIFISRAGQSATAVLFESTTPPPGTKFGTCHRSQRNTFVHIENIQPRIRDRSVNFPNDALAPVPGFSETQMERLALVYLVASVRSGKWLIPAYHSPIDLGYPDRHDDPQNFNLQTWATKLQQLIQEIRD